MNYADRTTMKKIPTAIPFLDRPLRGGQEPGQVYGLLGPTGAGKTTLGAQIAAEGARTLAASSQPGVWVFVTLDEAKSGIRARMISHLGMIERSKTRSMTKIANLNGPDMFSEYESRRRYDIERSFGCFLCEQERVLRAGHAIKHRLDALHLSGSYFSAGLDNPVEFILARMVAKVLKERPLAGAVIDWCGQAVSYEPLEGATYCPSYSRRLVQFVEDCRDRIARRYDCPVWVIHQLSGESIGQTPGAMQHHSDAHECRHFGEPLRACFVLGEHIGSDRFLLRCTKAPDKPPDDKPAVFHIDPDFATLRVSDGYSLDMVNRRIVSDRDDHLDIDDEAAAWILRKAPSR